MKEFCPDCGTEAMKFSSYSDIYCPECKRYHPWPLKDGQPSIHGDRIGGTEECVSRSYNSI